MGPTYLDHSSLLVLAMGDHAPKQELLAGLEQEIASGAALVSAVPTFELVADYFCRFRSLALWRDFSRTLWQLVPEVIELTKPDLERALELRELHSLSRGSALEAAIILNQSIERVISFEEELDAVHGIRRIVFS